MHDDFVVLIDDQARTQQYITHLRHHERSRISFQGVRHDVTGWNWSTPVGRDSQSFLFILLERGTANGEQRRADCCDVSSCDHYFAAVETETSTKCA